MSVAGYAAREAALGILRAQESEGAFLKDLFPLHAGALPKPDRAFVRTLCLGVVRNRSLLDYNIDAYAQKPPGPGTLRSILRLSAYQMLFLDVPAFAAVNLGVELVKRYAGKHQAGGRHVAGFANALLKKMAAQGLKRMPGESLRSLAVNFSHPEWLARRWHTRLGPAGLKAALARNNEEAPAFIRANPARATMAEVQSGLAGLGLSAAPEPEAPLFLRLEGSMEAALHSGLFERGAFAFQDPAAGLIARLAAWRPSESLLDLCAAPGGKAACLLEYALAAGKAGGGNGGASEDGPLASASPIVCNDLSFRRLRRIRDARERLGHQRLLPMVMDPAREALRGRFDCIVVDAPCSNLGVIRRRPEARWRHVPGDFARLAALQKGLLADAARLAAPRGRILYATCSPEDEESLEVVEAFLASHPLWRLEDASAFLPAFAVKRKCLWLHPGESEYDGFFAARLVRRE